MDYRLYQKLTKTQVVGRKVRLRRTISNGRYDFAAGTVMTIEDKKRGYTLKTDSCPTCGVSARVSRVEPYNVDLLESDEPAARDTEDEPEANQGK